MTTQKEKNTNLWPEETNKIDGETLELEEMLEQAEKEAQESEISPLIAKIAELEKQLQEKEEITKNSQIAYLHLKAAIQTLTVVEKEITKKIKLTFGYDQLSSVQYLLSKYEGSMLEGDYADRITQTLSINLACIESFEKALIERQIQILTY